ncbi:MAG TPA: family 10 glycosylhydrolase [Vicinamibacterales bacterium]|nr:family 10 glycosylhydrolase [Vicinamibacterales bacterium]
MAVGSGFSRTSIAQTQPSEVRAMWVQRASLTSPAKVLSVVETAKESGFNTLIVQVRGRGDAYYTSRHEPRPAALSSQPASFDPLDLMLATAHRAGLNVHAWINVNLVSDAEPPLARRHLVHAHPEWLMVPRPLAVELARMNPRNPAYLRRLSEYAKARSDRVEGVFLSPVHKGSVEHTAKVIGDIASRYEIDGIHLDYIRFPNDEFDYSEETLEQFRSEVLSNVSGAERREYSQRARGRPLFYTEMFPQRWQEFRRARLTALLTRIRATVKARRPLAILSAAVFPDATDATNRRFQDWGAWLHAGLLDAVCPMTYTTDPALFRAQIANVEQLAGERSVWAGIGAYQLSASATVDNIRAARQLGAEGIVLFSYDNLSSTYVETVANAAFR